MPVGNRWLDARRIAAASLAMLSSVPEALPAESRIVTFESVPAGAEVYQQKGFRQTRLGTTPLEHRFAVPSEQTVLRIVVTRAGFEPQSFELGDGDTYVAASLIEIPLVAPVAGDHRLADQIGIASAALETQRDAVLDALAPWSPLQPAIAVERSGLTLLEFEISAPRSRSRGDDASAVTQRLADVLSQMELGAAIDGLVLSFSRRRAGGVTTSVNTRLETKMVCEGGMVATSVWDNCAHRSATTSTTSTGTSTRYQCVGGTVTRQVYNACARRVPKRRPVVSVESVATTEVRRDTRLQFIDLRAADPRVVGHCDYRNGQLGATSGGDDSEMIRLICD